MKTRQKGLRAVGGHQLEKEPADKHMEGSIEGNLGKT